MLKSLELMYASRKLPSKYDGLICTFDLDKTYLATTFEKLSGLVKIPFEKAEEKRNIPGASAVARELRRGTQKDQTPVPIYFISGSPEMLETVIKQKLELDGVSFDGILFKDFRSAIKKFQFKKLIDKIGYKLGALIYARSVFPHKADEILFGDDSEYDATIYSLYSDIIAGNLEDFEVLTILKKWHVAPDEISMIRHNIDLLNKSGFKRRPAVKQIFIHLEVNSEPHEHSLLSDLVIPTHNYFQTAVMLHSHEYITRAGLFRIISDLIRTYDFGIDEFTSATEDLMRRKFLDKTEARKLLKIIYKGNPLALPRRWMIDLKSEFVKMMDTVTRMPESFMPPARRSSDRNISLVEKYLQHKPTRRV